MSAALPSALLPSAKLPNTQSTGVTLPSSVASPQDLAALVAEVKDYATWYNHQAVKQRFQTQTKANTDPVLSAAASQTIRGWFGTKTPHRQGFDALLKSLASWQKTAQSITVTLAAPAPNSLKATLVSWFRTNVSPTALVTFRINSTILGGMVVQYGSHVFDWSFRRCILDNKQAFSGVLRRV